MSTTGNEDVEGLTEATAESTGPGLGGALLSVWYLWIATVVSGAATYIAMTHPDLEASATDTLLFSFTTVLLFFSALALAYYRTR